MRNQSPNFLRALPSSHPGRGERRGIAGGEGGHRVLLDGVALSGLGGPGSLGERPLSPEELTAGTLSPLRALAAAGDVAVIWVAELTVKLAAAVAPNVTAVAPVKFVPVIVTVVPPAIGPEVGEIDVTVGAAI